jgi:transposase
LECFAFPRPFDIRASAPVPNAATDPFCLPSADVDCFDIKKGMLVMDRGYYSERNLNNLMKEHSKFVIGAKISLKFIQAQIGNDRDGFDRREFYNSETGLFVKTRTMEWDYEEMKQKSGEVAKGKRRIYVHIYYDDQHATDDKIRFNKRLDAMETDILSGKMKPEREFVLLSNGAKDPAEALRISG